MKFILIVFIWSLSLPLFAQHKRANVNWDQLRAPTIKENMTQSDLDFSNLSKTRGPAAQKNIRHGDKRSHGQLNVYASCVDGQGVIRSSSSHQYENCLRETVGGRQIFVQDGSRGLILMLNFDKVNVVH